MYIFLNMPLACQEVSGAMAALQAAQTSTVVADLAAEHADATHSKNSKGVVALKRKLRERKSH